MPSQPSRLSLALRSQPFFLTGHNTDQTGLSGGANALCQCEEEDGDPIPSGLPDLDISKPCEMERHARCCGFIVPMESDSDALVECDCECHIFQNS